MNKQTKIMIKLNAGLLSYREAVKLIDEVSKDTGKVYAIAPTCGRQYELRRGGGTLEYTKQEK